MKFLSLEDTTGTFEAVIFPREYEKYAEKTMSMGPYIIVGKVDENDTTNVVVSELGVVPAHQQAPGNKKIVLKINIMAMLARLEKKILCFLKDLIKKS